MPALSSSPTDPVLDHLVQAVDHHQLGGDLLARLAGVPDPRARRGRRHPLTVILALAVCAVLAGARSYAALGQWAADTTPQVRAALGATRAPSEACIRRTLQRLDGDQVDTTIGAWTAAATTPEPAHRRLVALDGKQARGSGSTTTTPRHLLGALDHTHGIVLAQRQVGSKTNEITHFRPLLDRVDLTGAVITADALHTQRAHADYLVLQRQADYLLTVKANQPTLHAQLKALPWKDVPVAHASSGRAHGRVEKRSVKAVTVSTGILFPHARQAVQIVRKTRRLDSTEWTTEVAYAVTSLAAEQATAYELATWIRGHWAIENRLHWVRDVTLDEDRSQVRTGNGPRVMASLRNLVISMLRLAGATNMAAAMRYCSWDRLRPVNLLLTC